MRSRIKNGAVPALCIALTLFLLGGCHKTETVTDAPPPAETAAATAAPEAAPEPAETDDAALPEAFPMEMTFSSGAGAWMTVITLERDGSFSGEYHDSDMGDSGDGYPNGTVYVCAFEGKYSDIRRDGDSVWHLTMESVTLRDTEGEEWIEDGIRYVASIPYGMEEGTEYFLYAPETPTEGLNEEFLSWWPGRYEEQPAGTLSCWGLYNAEMGYGFFS